MKYDFRKLKAKRVALRLTQTELAKRAGLSVGAVSTVESGKGPWLKAIREMERILDVQVIKKAI